MAHITVAQRYTISVLNARGKSQKEIAHTIDKDKSVVSRELKRNSDHRSGIYSHALAQRKYRERMDHKPKYIRFSSDVQAYVEHGIRKDFSPEQIAGIARNQSVVCVSHERIYQYIWADKKNGGTLYKHLRTHGKRYRKRGNSKDRRGIIPHRRDIDERPPIVDEKQRFGDWEIDTVIGKNHQGALVTINDRTTGLVKIRKVERKDAARVANAAIEALMPYMKQLHTITAENGKEFALHQTISEKLNIDFYFAKPYHAWERGANENINGLIRQYFPKKTDFASVTDEHVQTVENILNNRPRKRFDFLSPNQIVHQFQKVALVT
jgi:IS30 family transposase